MEGDGGHDILSHIIELLGLNWWDFINDETVLSREQLELNIEEVLDVANDPSENPGYFLILGYYILKTGAEISDELKNKIAEATKWEYEETIYPNKKMEEERKVVLKDLRDKILDHELGKIVSLIEDGGGIAPKLFVQEKEILEMLEKGYSLQQIREVTQSDSSEKISEEELIENIKWHFHIKSDEPTDEVFREVRRKVLAQKFIDYFGIGVRTKEELSQKFISFKNPNGIPLKELEDLVKDCLSVNSWEEAINKFGYPTDVGMDTYIEEVCGINTEKFVEEEEEITREMVETHFNDLVEMIRRWSNPVGYLKLGRVILEANAKLPEVIKKEIIEMTSNLENSEDIDKKLLHDFQDKIKVYSSS